jgi:hypothetical protein
MTASTKKTRLEDEIFYNFEGHQPRPIERDFQGYENQECQVQDILENICVLYDEDLRQIPMIETAIRLNQQENF